MHQVELGAIALRMITLLVVQYRKVTACELTQLLKEMGIYHHDIDPFMARIENAKPCRYERRCQGIALQAVVRIIELGWYDYTLFLSLGWIVAPQQAGHFIQSIKPFVGKHKHARETMLEL